MLLCKVHNLITGERYKFQAADQAEMDARLERKAATYGRDVWTETIPAWTQTGVWSTDEPPVFDPEAVIEHPEQVIEHPAERTVEVTTLDLSPERIARAWAAAKDCIERQFDSYSQISATNLRMDPACPVWRAERIGSVMLWISTVWAHYAQVKASIQAGVDTNFDPAICGPCPFTIWQIAGRLRALGHDPDIAYHPQEQDRT